MTAEFLAITGTSILPTFKARRHCEKSDGAIVRARRRGEVLPDTGFLPWHGRGGDEQPVAMATCTRPAHK